MVVFLSIRKTIERALVCSCWAMAEPRVSVKEFFPTAEIVPVTDCAWSGICVSMKLAAAEEVALALAERTIASSATTARSKRTRKGIRRLFAMVEKRPPGDRRCSILLAVERALTLFPTNNRVPQSPGKNGKLLLQLAAGAEYAGLGRRLRNPHFLGDLLVRPTVAFMQKECAAQRWIQAQHGF